MYPDWQPHEFRRFEFYIRKDGLLGKAKGRHQLTEAGYNEIMEQFHAPVRSKVDLREWKLGHPFHFVRD